MNNEAIAAYLSCYLPLSDRGANNPSTNLSFYLEFLIFGARGAKEVGGTNSFIYPRNGWDLLNEILDRAGLGMSQLDAGKPKQSVPINHSSRSNGRKNRLLKSHC